LGAENVFKIAIGEVQVREYLTARGWEFSGSDKETEMDAYRNRKTGKLLFIEDISEDFPVTFLMGELGMADFGKIAHDLTPDIALMEVESSWEGKPTTIVVAMSKAQVRNMFGKRARMRQLPISNVASQA